MTDSLLDRALYSYADVDRLVGLHSGTARRWLEGYSRSEKLYDPILREEPTGTDSVTWGEMVEARLLAEFRSRRVPVQRLRPAIVLLRKEFGRSNSSSCAAVRWSSQIRRSDSLLRLSTRTTSSHV